LALPRVISEKEIQNAILDYLALLPNCIAFPVQNGAIFDPTRNIFRKPAKHWRKGVSDILGIFNGKPLAIEVKKPKSYASKEQKRFIEDYKFQGGIAFIARSVQEVIDNLSTAT